MPRRSAREMRMGELLQIGQEWALSSDLEMWTVTSVHRRDCKVVLTNCAGGRMAVGFDELAKYWEPRDYSLLEAA